MRRTRDVDIGCGEYFCWTDGPKDYYAAMEIKSSLALSRTKDASKNYDDTVHDHDDHHHHHNYYYCRCPLHYIHFVVPTYILPDIVCAFAGRPDCCSCFRLVDMFILAFFSFSCF
jgi:hypothetical protein